MKTSNAVHGTLIGLAVVSAGVLGPLALGQDEQKLDGWQKDFGIEKLTLETTGESRYLVLKPGFQIVLENDEDKVTISVLDDTEVVDGITTRVVEEREEEDGEIVEVSRNFFAIAKETGDVFYFGEEVDDYKKGKLVGHHGAWRAGEKKAKPGMIMPAAPIIGAKYYLEIAPGEAMDRAENLSLTETLKTPAGTFQDCLKTQEGTELNPLEKEFKTYAPGIGIIQDEDLLLTRHGYVALPKP